MNEAGEWIWRAIGRSHSLTSIGRIVATSNHSHWVSFTCFLLARYFHCRLRSFSNDVKKFWQFWKLRHDSFSPFYIGFLEKCTKSVYNAISTSISTKSFYISLRYWNVLRIHYSFSMFLSKMIRCDDCQKFSHRNALCISIFAKNTIKSQHCMCGISSVVIAIKIYLLRHIWNIHNLTGNFKCLSCYVVIGCAELLESLGKQIHLQASPVCYFSTRCVRSQPASFLCSNSNYWFFHSFPVIPRYRKHETFPIPLFQWGEYHIVCQRKVTI